MDRLFVKICVAYVTVNWESNRRLLALWTSIASDWFVRLPDEENRFLKLGLVAKNCDVNPRDLTPQSGSRYLTFVVADVVSVLATAQKENYSIREMPTRQIYRQTRMVLKSLEGSIIDVSSPN